jgi:hypothetical protein
MQKEALEARESASALAAEVAVLQGKHLGNDNNPDPWECCTYGAPAGNSCGSGKFWTGSEAGSRSNL